MKVTRVGPAKDVAPAKKKAKAAPAEGASFADNLQDTQSAASAAVASDAAAVTGVDAVLATQQVADPTDDRPARRRLVEYGDDLLDQLDDLRLGILAGAYSKDRLAELAQKLRQKRNQSSDPRLNELINEIELRAEVEIAKYSRKVE